MPRADASLYALFRSRFPADRGRVFLRGDGGLSVTYFDVEKTSARLQHVLHKSGVGPGDRVAAQVEKSWTGLCLYLAALRAGAVFVPLNPAATAREMAHFLGDSAPRIFVCAKPSPELHKAARAAGVSTIFHLGADGGGDLADALAAETGAGVDAIKVDGGHLAAILYTSGTTGRPKGAALSHANLAHNAETLRRLWQINGGDVLLHTLPIFHVHGLFVSLHCALLGGAAVIFLRRFDEAQVLRRIAGATLFMGVPTFYTRLLSRGELSRELCAGMRLFISGSAQLSPAVFTAFAERTGHRIVDRYGMTETGILTSNPLEFSRRRGGDIGFALPGVELRVRSAAGETMAPGESGVLEVRGRGVFNGYWRMEKSEKDFTPDGFFRTGDLATITVDGRVTLMGRAKDLIISGGVNIYPAELEQLIDAIPGVTESAVIGVPHEEWGEAVTAVVTLEAGANLTPTDIRNALSEKIARYKLPKAVHFRDRLPRNAMGKILKNRLREEFS